MLIIPSSLISGIEGSKATTLIEFRRVVAYFTAAAYSATAVIVIAAPLFLPPAIISVIEL